VYNVEVAGDHCYRVGQQGLLVHNISPADCKRDPRKVSNPCDLPPTAFCQAPCDSVRNLG
jgi:hypothetical protein